MSTKDNKNSSNTKSKNVLDNLEGFVEKLAEIVDNKNLTEIEIEHNDSYIKVSKTVQQVVSSNISSAPVVNTAPANVRTPAVTPKAEVSTADLASNPNVLLAPMVGTIYNKASPEDPEFKKVGDSVKKGDTVFLIEAMKVFSPIKAHKDGKVIEIFVQTGNAVEYNQPLMLID